VAVEKRDKVSGCIGLKDQGEVLRMGRLVKSMQHSGAR
jgi:hypothetical protein